jgi:hypothetical protein
VIRDPLTDWYSTLNPPEVDEEPWLWTCPDCGSSMARGDIPAHRADEARRSAGVIVWLLGSLAVTVLVALVVVLIRWPR